jgi:simple sugar transport system permease protein
VTGIETLQSERPETALPSSQGTFGSRLLNFIVTYGMLIAIFLLILFFSQQTKAFLSLDNFLLIARAASILIIVAVGVTLSVAVGGFDVSVGSVTGLSVMLTTSLMIIWQVPWYFAIAIALVAGIIIGFINAFLIIRLRIPDLLATLGMLYLIQGMQLVITMGNSVYKGMANPWDPKGGIAPGVIPQIFLDIGQGAIFKTEQFVGIPVAVIFTLILVIVAHIFLQYTRWGRMFYAVGGNLEAARLSGIPVHRIRTAAYVLSAILATLGGIVLASRVGSGAVKAGEAYLLDSVAATYFGFAVLRARRPNVFGTVLGALFVGIMLNGLTMMNLAWYYQDMIKGAVLIVSLALSFYLVKQRR